jgi:hypothetical protein
MIWTVQAMNEAETGAVEMAAPESQTSPHPERGDPASDWLCAWCLNRVASEKDRFGPDGKSEFTFPNPEGVRFHILTFSRTPGCRPVGVPTLEYTWFPDHAWSCCVCGRCGVHLGWHYTGPTRFAGSSGPAWS